MAPTLRAGGESDASLDLVNYASQHPFDSRQLSLDTGPHGVRANGQAELYLPLGLSRTTLGDSGYAATAFFAPQASYRLQGQDQLISALQLQLSKSL